MNGEIWNLLGPVLLLNLAQKLGSVFERVLVSVLFVHLVWGAAGIWGGFLVSNVVSLCVISGWAWYQLNQQGKHGEMGKG